MMDWFIGYIDDRDLAILVVTLSALFAVVAIVVILTAMRHRARIELDQYGKFRGSGPAKSFVCPDCLNRSYAPSHVEKRWCPKCQKVAPKRIKAQKLPKPPRWLTDDLILGG